MNINLIILTEKTPSFYVEARKEYEKRLSRFCKLKTRCVKTEEKALKEINPKYPLIVIDKRGRSLTSEELADTVSAAENLGHSSVNVMVGIDVSEKEIPCLKFSVTQFDLSVDLTAVVVLEQIYRAYKMLSGETYHK